MPKPKKGPRLGGSPAHQRLMVANLATQLFEHGRITTTEAKARVLRPVAEKLITKAKRGDLHNRREVLKTVRDKTVVHVLFTEIAPTFAERPGGYTRITKIGNRKGDNAPMAVIELVTEPYEPKGTAKPAKKTTAKKATPNAAPAEETSVEATSAEAGVEESPVEEIPADEAATDEAEVDESTDEAAADEAAPDEAGVEESTDEAEEGPAEGATAHEGADVSKESDKA